MREIKFRAWTTEYNRFLDCECSQFQNYIHGYANPVARKEGWKTITVQQYIGLKDKNGKEIYEGDILHNGCMIGEIRYSYKSFHLDNIKIVGYAFETSKDSNPYIMFEVVGNIFENPDLIENFK